MKGCQSRVSSIVLNDSGGEDLSSGETPKQLEEQDFPTHNSNSQEKHDDDIYAEAGDQIYNRFSKRRKRLITFTVSLCGFLSPMSSTTVLSAIPEVAQTFQTTGSVINISNALYLAFMGLSPLVFGPLTAIYGRRWLVLSSGVLFTAWSISTALAPNLASFFMFRMLTAFQGTGFLIIGSTIISDIYRPVERATALGWFLCGTQIGPALGPFIGGLIVTYRSWRVIFWLQSALASFATILVIVALPETIHRKKAEELKQIQKGSEKAKKICQWMNPFRVFVLFKIPNLAIMGLGTGSLVWNMYSLMSPIRYVLNPRFNLTTPLQSGLFFLAPGCGYVLGTLVGGQWADYTVKKWIRKRGTRIPEDRLRSSLPFMGFIIPACMLIYGWSVDKEKGGIALPVITMFLQGIAQLFCFPSLNVYCLEVIPGRSSEVIGGNYVARYISGAIGTAVAIPAIEKIGVGWFSTISAVYLVFSTVLVYVTVLFGAEWRSKASKA
ncbi:unnamed protein product [Clonostachys rosea]|uniref:Major facilitator superfamily (MFS) profile domain-containing protein n=1 Tax=Bionectria ochroleuca TaxID=29856 RepID=A0ABY6UH40_BIOOC|nr:unnamed protein product [Clonostachys rosea]